MKALLIGGSTDWEFLPNLSLRRISSCDSNPMLTAYSYQYVSDLRNSLQNINQSGILINGKEIAQPTKRMCCVSHQFPSGNWMKCGCSSVVERHLAKSK